MEILITGQYFRNFEIIFFFFVVAMSDLVHKVIYSNNKARTFNYKITKILTTKLYPLK